MVDQKWLLRSAYDSETGMCPDQGEGNPQGLYLPRRQLQALELREARLNAGPWKGSWEPSQHDEQRQLLEQEPTRKCPVRVGTRHLGQGRQGRIHKFHNGIVSANGNEIYFIGIIDILTEYHKLKRLANCCKKFAFFEDQLKERAREGAEWVTLPQCGGRDEQGCGDTRVSPVDEGEWQRLRKRRNSLRWQYCSAGGVREDLRRAHQQARGAQLEAQKSCEPSSLVD
eukprot:gene49139-9887_t